MTQLPKVFELKWQGFSLRTGVFILAVLLLPYIVLAAIGQQKYWISVSFGALFVLLSDPGGDYADRAARMAEFAVIGALLTALGFGVGGEAWGLVVLAAFTLLAGIAVGKPVQAPVLGRRVTRAVAVIAAARLIAFLAFLAGEHQQRQVTVLSGVAGVGGDHTASVTVAGSSWVYGISGVDQWVDRQGETHIGGWPTCLSMPEETVPITFGWVPVTAPDGSSWRQVVWVDCRS